MKGVKGMNFFVKICLIGVGVAMLTGLTWACLFLGLHFSKEPLKPEHIYGEFPYKLVYELNGEKHTVEGKYICRYDGISTNEGRGKYRTWTGYVEETNEDSVFIYENEEVAIYCYIGDAGYYMGDHKYSGHAEGKLLQPHLFGKPKNKGNIGLSEVEIFERYGIRILEYSLSEPIINSFK